ncbi:MAG TPA: DUF1015 domain-containing protein [Burkholderiaceae bacterium]|nr:DUF1015 domain-containing protein [Burkholderiaceae bacterium]
MSANIGFRLPRIWLPRHDLDLRKWAVVACDQYTSEPAYWHDVEAEVGDAPSTLHLIFPEVYLGSADAAARIGRIQDSMRQYLSAGLLVEHDGAVYVERTIDGRVRRGMMLEIDLEHYDFDPASTSLVRPTEGTIVARLAPRIEIRRDAELELPHVLVLIDDPADSVIGPIAAARGALNRLYETDLMRGGGHVAGYAIDDALAARAMQALDALADPAAFALRHGVAEGTPPILFAVGDGNHSLATAKTLWNRVRATVGSDAPSRYALVEVMNIHDAALEFSPIHRLLFGVSTDVRAALSAAFGARLACLDVASAAAMRERLRTVRGRGHAAGLVGPGQRYSVVEVAQPQAATGVGTFQPFIDELIARGGAREVDYIHGDDVLEQQSTAAADRIGFHLDAVAKDELLGLVVRGGPLPRKTFSMGEAHEKRFYIEARRIRGGVARP